MQVRYLHQLLWCQHWRTTPATTTTATPTAAATGTAMVPASAPSASVGGEPPTQQNRYPLRTRKGMDCFDPLYYDRIMAKAFAAAIEPKTHEQAIKSPNSALWLVAEKEEIDNLLSNKTWDLVDLPPGRKAIGVRWVYKIKLNDQGAPDRYKARLVAKGYTQKQGLDYQETFAPVAKMTSIRVIVAVAAHNNWSIHQLNVTAAYLNGVVDAEIFMAQPPATSTLHTQIKCAG